MPSLAPVDYDPFAKAPPAKPRMTPVDHDPWAQDTALRGELLSDVPGARITSTFRTSAHNAAVGGVRNSRHLSDDAVDFIPPAGMTRAQALAAIRARDPKPQELLDEGDHIHYSPSRIPQLTPVDHDPFKAGGAAPTPAPKPTPAPQPAVKPSDQWNPGADFMAPINAAAHQVMEDIRARSKGKSTSPGSLMDIPHVLGVPLSVLQAAANVPIQAAARGIESTGIPLYEPGTLKPTKGVEARRAQIANALGTASLAIGPEGGEAGAAKAVAGGREAAAAAEAPALRTSSLPKPPELTPVEGDPFEAAGAPKRRTLPAAVELPPRTNIVGDEANPATRTANALYRLNGSNIADKIELGRARTELQRAHGDKSEALYHALEEPLAKPGAQTPPELAEAKAALEPYLKEQTEIINRLRQRNDPALDPFLEDQGYVHRIRSDQPDILDASDQGGPRSPFLSRKSLVKTASAQKARKFIALEDPDTGQRFLKDTSKEREYRELKPGMEYRPPGEGPAGAKPKTFKVVQPTTAEIEAGSEVRYKKDAIDNTITNVFQLRRVERNLDVLEQTLQDMKERGVAHKAEVRFKGPDGENRWENTKGEVPKGFRVLPDVPQLKGWVFNHDDAQVQELKDWLPKHDEGWIDSLDRLNNFMLRSNFLSPFVHPKNIAEFWGVSRGWDWLHPEGYGRLARTLPEAWREVMTVGPKYRQYLREGSALLSADARTQDFNRMLTDTAGKQLLDDPKSVKALTDAMGVKMNPAALYKAFQEASHKMMWSLGDTMMMQRVLELQEKGTPIRDAIRKAEEVIPNYRVPAQIMDSPTGGRMLHHLFANNRFFSVGRYHYNRLAAWGRMFKKVAKGTPEEKVEAAGQFVAMAVMGAIIIPAIDKAVQIATGNQNARVKRGGILSLPDAAVRTATGQEGVAQAIAQVIDLSPEARLTTEGVTNKDWKGDDILSKFKSPASNVGGLAGLAVDQFGPLQGGIEALNPNYGPARTAANMVGVDLPQKAPGEVKGSTAKMLRGKYRKQDRNDPFVQGLQALGVP